MTNTSKAFSMMASGVELAKGQTTAEVARRLEITQQTDYRWRKEYGGLRLDQAKRFKELEKENARLKKLVADQALDDASAAENAVRGRRRELARSTAVIPLLPSHVRELGARRRVTA
jgi:hypothetical protein